MDDSCSHYTIKFCFSLEGSTTKALSNELKYRVQNAKRSMTEMDHLINACRYKKIMTFNSVGHITCTDWIFVGHFIFGLWTPYVPECCLWQSELEDWRHDLICLQFLEIWVQGLVVQSWDRPGLNPLFQFFVFLPVCLLWKLLKIDQDKMHEEIF